MLSNITKNKKKKNSKFIDIDITKLNRKIKEYKVSIFSNNKNIRKKKFCFFKKNKIKYIDYKNPKFLIIFLNETGKILPRRITGTSTKYQKRLTKAIKRCRFIGLLPYVSDNLR